jgi:hypothetical protein
MEYQKPEYSMSFDDDNGQVLKSAEHDLQALTKKVLHALNPAPVIDDLPDTYLKLPAGLIVDGKVIRDVEVQELNGEHEEKLAKARTSASATKYMSTLLMCGVVSIGDSPVSQTLLDTLIQGDLDMLMLGIRRATFGDEFELFNIECPNCKEHQDIKMNLKDIPVKELDDPTVREFEVPIRKGRKVRCEYPTGKVQNEIFKNPMTISEMNSLTLSHCINSFVDADGTERMSNGLTDVKKMAVMDRNMVIDYIFNNQPGPRYDQVVAKCGSCEGEVPVPLNVGVLFRDL